MAENVVTVNGVSVASTSSHPTHINIHVYEESALTQLLKAAGSLKQFLSQPRDTRPSKAGKSNEQLALGVTQIALGVVSCALGVSLSFGPRSELRGLGCAFWAGAAAIAAGAGAIVHQKRRGKLSGCVLGLLMMAGIAAAAATGVFSVRSSIWQTDESNYSEFISVCDSLVPAATTNEHNQRNSYSAWKTESCRNTMKMTLNLFLAFCILLIVVCVLHIALSLACLGLHLRSMCGQSSQSLDEEESEQKLLGVNPESPPASKEETLTVVNL